MNYYILSRTATISLGQEFPKTKFDEGFRDLRRALTGDCEVYMIYPEDWAAREERIEWLVAHGIDHHYMIHDVCGPSPVEGEADDYRRYLLLCVPNDDDAFELRLHFNMLPIPTDLDGVDRFCSLLNYGEVDPGDRPVWL